MTEPVLTSSWTTDTPICTILRRFSSTRTSENGHGAESLVQVGDPGCGATHEILETPTATSSPSVQRDTSSGTQVRVAASAADDDETPLELCLQFQDKVRVTRLEVETDARVVEWLVDGEYAASARTVDGSSDGNPVSSSNLRRGVCQVQLRPGKSVTARLRQLPDVTRATISEVVFDANEHVGGNPAHSFDMALVRERLGSSTLTPEAQSLMTRIDVHRKAAASSPGMAGLGGMGMLGALAAATGNSGSGDNGMLPPMLAGFLGSVGLSTTTADAHFNPTIPESPPAPPSKISSAEANVADCACSCSCAARFAELEERVVLPLQSIASRLEMIERLERKDNHVDQNASPKQSSELRPHKLGQLLPLASLSQLDEVVQKLERLEVLEEKIDRVLLLMGRAQNTVMQTPLTTTRDHPNGP